MGEDNHVIFIFRHKIIFVLDIVIWPLKKTGVFRARERRLKKLGGVGERGPKKLRKLAGEGPNERRKVKFSK
jgi:hypothetical protein